MDKIWPTMQMFNAGVTELGYIREHLNDLLIKQNETSELIDDLMDELENLQDKIDKLKMEAKTKC